MDFIEIIFSELQRTGSISTDDSIDRKEEQLVKIINSMRGWAEDTAKELDNITGELSNGYLELGFRKGFEVAKAIYK